VIEWADDHAGVVGLVRGADDDGAEPTDDSIVSAMGGRWPNLPLRSKLAIDTPLRSDGPSTSPGPPAGSRSGSSVLMTIARGWSVAQTTTVHRVASKLPLSVTTYRIAYAAMRPVGLLAHYAGTSDKAIDRSGIVGLVCETYRDPSIRRLGLWPPGCWCAR
jgi:hypothetical protein